MGVLKKAEMPKWVTRINEMAPNITEAGLHGLLDHAEVLMPLGEVLARRQIDRDELQLVVDRLLEKARSRDVSRPVHRNVISDIGTEAFWEHVWEQILGRKIQIPRIPKIKAKTLRAIKEYGLKLVYLPAITESDYPEGFIKPEWGTELIPGATERFPLAGRWMLVETILQPETDVVNRLQISSDELFLDHSDGICRMQYSWDGVMGDLVQIVAQTFGLPKRAVRLPSVEELNLIGNLFRWLNANCHQSLPDLHANPKRELCLNKFRREHHLTLCGESRTSGDIPMRGLACVEYIRSKAPFEIISFRLIIVP